MEINCFLPFFHFFFSFSVLCGSQICICVCIRYAMERYKQALEIFLKIDKTAPNGDHEVCYYIGKFIDRFIFFFFVVILHSKTNDARQKIKECLSKLIKFWIKLGKYVHCHLFFILKNGYYGLVNTPWKSII